MSIQFFSFSFLGTVFPRVGRHRLAGTVTVAGKPAERIVIALDRRNFSLLAGTLSLAKNGAWQMIGLPEWPEKSLLVVALDNSGAYNAEVADYVTQTESAS